MHVCNGLEVQTQRGSISRLGESLYTICALFCFLVCLFFSCLFMHDFCLIFLIISFFLFCYILKKFVRNKWITFIFKDQFSLAVSLH